MSKGTCQEGFKLVARSGATWAWRGKTLLVWKVSRGTRNTRGVESDQVQAKGRKSISPWERAVAPRETQPGSAAPSWVTTIFPEKKLGRSAGGNDLSHPYNCIAGQNRNIAQAVIINHDERESEGSRKKGNADA